MLEKILSYSFKNKDLLEQALCHKSAGKKHYERLEFLGDRVLALGAATFLGRLYPHFSEGDMAVALGGLVSEDTLYEVACTWQLMNFIKCQGKNLRYNPTILADVVESIIGAIYLDSSGIEKPFLLIENMLHSYVDNLPSKNPKTILQEWAIKNKKILPEYKVIQVTGPDHAPHFVVECTVNTDATYGEGKNKREAKMQAAKMFLDKIGYVLS